MGISAIALPVLAVCPLATASWVAPRVTSINNLTCVLTCPDAPGIFNSSQTPDASYGTYNYCNMPHVRAMEYPHVPVRYKLEYVEVLQRHHKRTPYLHNTFPREDMAWDCANAKPFAYASGGARVYWEGYGDPANPLDRGGFNGSCQFPQITEGGLDDAFQHGKDLYGVYGTLLGFIPSGFDPEKTVFRVTNNIITSQVAGAVIGGMFGTSDEVPVLQQSDSIDSLRPGYACEYANSLRAGYQGSAPNWTEHLTRSQKLFAKLDAISGVDPGNNLWHSWWDRYFDNLSSRTCHQFPLPCSMTNHSTCIPVADANTVFRLGQYEYSYIYRDAPESFNYARAKYGVFAHELKSRLMQWISGAGGVRYTHNIAHDESVSLILGLLQVSEMVWPGMGSEVVVELYSMLGQRWYVRVLWGGQVMESSALGKIDMLEADVFLQYLTDSAGDSAAFVLDKCVK